MYDFCIDSGLRFSKTGLSWVEAAVLRILSGGKVECLGCFVHSRLSIRNSSNRWVRVFFRGGNVLLHRKDGMERGLYPGGCHVMWRAGFTVSSFPRDVFRV